MADTERWNEAAQLPRYVVTPTSRPDGSVEFLAKAQVGPFSVCWQEIPTNWVKNSWFVHERRFTNGPLATLCATLKVYLDGDGCRGEYILSAQPRNLLGWFMLATTFLPSTKKQFDALAEQARRFATGATDSELETNVPKLQDGATDFMQQAAGAIASSPHNHDLAPRLVEYIATRPEVDVRRIRPLTLAQKWGVKSSDAIELCLQAARDQLLGISWDLLCPRCQGAKAKASSLDLLPQTAHCASCNIDYGRDYAKNVEMSFFPSTRVRRIDDREFCLFGPMTTPHIWAQITVAPGQSTKIECPSLPKGSLRIRTLEAGPEATVEWHEGGFPDVVADVDGVQAVAASSPGVVTFTNQTAKSITFVIDETAWSSQALTADRAMSLQAFRDLFDDSILRPGDHLQIDHVTIMFVDFKGSSALYEDAGDVNAYQLVREFFSVAGAAVRKHDGAIVKTVGDAVNAAFYNPQDAFACALEIQQAFADYNSAFGNRQITSKIGIHMGKTIAVTLNNRLDYYGTAVNRAARLSDMSKGGDIVLSADLADEPCIAGMLDGMFTSTEQALAKGFSMPVGFVRVTPRKLPPLEAVCAVAAA